MEVEEETLNASKRLKIEETVSQILQTSDLETATELHVRTAAAERLGLDLSSLPHRRLVRQLVDKFLLSTATAILKNNNNNDCDFIETEKNKQKLSSNCGGGGGVNYDGKVICQLSENRKVTIHSFNGSNLVSIRDFYIKDGNMLPRKGLNTGLSLTGYQWSTFRNSFPAIDEAIVKLESRLRSEAIAKQNKADATISAATKSATPNSREHIHAEEIQEAGISTQSHPAVDAVLPEVQLTQNEASISNSVPPPTQLHDTVNNAVRPERLVPIQPTRLDGRNYNSWRHQMELFLTQLNIAYVLTVPNPSSSSNPVGTSDENGKRWVDDDYLCRHNILSSLSDNLFQFYSQKCSSARELWEELKLAYNDDFGTKRSQINKYVHFQMVDGVSVVEQVKELHKLADSIWALGTWIDENFHASVIVSKLPPSWKEFRARLMQEEFLPVNMLMHRLQIEEESRRCYKKENNYKKGGHHILEPKLGMRKKENKRVCFCCGKEGHMVKNCPNNSEGRETSNAKENGATNPDTEANVAETTNID